MSSTRSDLAHLYRRAGFGASPAEIDDAASAGYSATVASLLAGLGSVPDPKGDNLTVPTFAPFERPSGTEGSPERLAAAKALDHTFRSELAPLQEWWLNRMIVTSTPLREKMTFLWHGHFATAVMKVKDPHLMYRQNDLFRRAGAGSFEALTQSVAKDGAMMIWLDTETDKAAHPNENFARECMELFTLGVGSFSQNDVEEVARCFTGWAYDRTTDRCVLEARQHDDGIKTVLGHTGDFDGEDALSIIVRQPASARFVVASLWSHLAYPVAPSDAVVTDLLAAYGPSFDLTALLRAVFLHPAFLSPAARTGLIKQPVEYLVGAARSLRLDARAARLDPETGLPVPATPDAHHHPTLATLATSLAQTPFDPPNVSGWPQNGYWLNTATSLARLRAGQVLARAADLSALASLSETRRPDAVAELLGVVDSWGPTTAAALATVVDDPTDLVTLALNSPEYLLN